ncbi:MAG: thiamine pyrophosphate-dependent dehydrogenase E1 component subunit alpha [Kribbellaceae bacterium]
MSDTLAPPPTKGLDADGLLAAYTTMRTIRAFEERVHEEFASGDIPGFVHLYAGEEASAAGVCAHLDVRDSIASTHRGHGHCIAKGVDPVAMMAEIYGKLEGSCRGKGGSMHIADQERGNLGANAIVGGSTGIATGAAMSAKLRGSDQVAVCFFGEGALGQGLLYEVLNMASLWKLPVLYVCENNLYNEYTHYSETTAGEIGARPAAFGIPVEEVDGQNVRAVYAAAARLVERARAGDGPSFLLCNTYRFHGHHVGDVDRAYYRAAEEEATWTGERDPLRIHAEWLVGEGGATRAQLERVGSEIAEEIEAAVVFALDAPFPDPGEVDQHVYP